MENSPDKIHEPVGESCTAVLLEEGLEDIRRELNKCPIAD